MSKRLTKALLRLCELEKKAQETDADFWKQEVILTNKAFKEIEETNRQLQSVITEEMALAASLHEQVAKARFERDQARVQLKALAEENERLQETNGWVHIRDWVHIGKKRLIVGLFLDGKTALVNRIVQQWYIRGLEGGLVACGPPAYIYELPEPPIQKQVGEPSVSADIAIALESA